MEEEGPHLEALDLRTLKKLRTQLRGLRTRCRTDLAMNGSLLKMTAPGTRNHLIAEMARKVILEQQQQALELLAAVEREVQKRMLRGEGP